MAPPWNCFKIGATLEGWAIFSLLRGSWVTYHETAPGTLRFGTTFFSVKLTFYHLLGSVTKWSREVICLVSMEATEAHIFCTWIKFGRTGFHPKVSIFRRRWTFDVVPNRWAKKMSLRSFNKEPTRTSNFIPCKSCWCWGEGQIRLSHCFSVCNVLLAWAVELIKTLDNQNVSYFLRPLGGP